MIFRITRRSCFRVLTEEILICLTGGIVTLQKYQFDSIMREYSRRQARGLRIQQEYRQEILSRFPRIGQIDQEIASKSTSCLRDLLQGKRKGTDTLREDISRLSQEKKELLAQGGYPADYLEPAYTCPYCQDTGFIGSSKCSCFQKAEITLLYSQSHINAILDRDTFEAFSLDYYSDTVIHEATGQSERQMARRAYDAARNFVNSFGRSFNNLFLYGDTGVGKTFLSHCIAHELLSQAHCVLYFSSHDLFEQLAGYAFAREQTGGAPEDILDAELLIIDDLGTELTNSFVTSQLFLCVNERLNRSKPTIISTNLSLKDFSSAYSERTFSRIAGNYQMIKLVGKDIRLQKRFAGNHA